MPGQVEHYGVIALSASDISTTRRGMLWCMCLAGSSGPACSGRIGRASAPSADTAWVGTSDQARDGAFDRFRRAVERHRLHGRRPPMLRYVTVRDEGVESAYSDLTRLSGPRPDLWVTPTADTARAVKRLDSGVPLVFATYLDPVALQLVASARRPGGLCTGVWLGDELHSKRFELLRDAYPHLRVVGVLLDTSWRETRDLQATLVAPAARQGLSVQLYTVDQPDHLDTAWRLAGERGVEAWYIPATYVAYQAEAAIITALRRRGWPSIHATTAEVQAGAPLAYAQEPDEVFDQLADLTLRIMGGEDPGLIPVQRARRFVLAVRPRAAARLPAMAPSVIRRADRVFL